MYMIVCTEHGQPFSLPLFPKEYIRTTIYNYLHLVGLINNLEMI